MAWQDVSLAPTCGGAVEGSGLSLADLGEDLGGLCLGGGQSYSLFTDKDELQRRLAVVSIETYSSKGKQEVRRGGRPTPVGQGSRAQGCLGTGPEASAGGGCTTPPLPSGLLWACPAP